MMTRDFNLTRREMLVSGGTSALSVAICSPSFADHHESTNERRLLLAPDYTVAAEIPDPAFYMHDPGMTVLPGGGIFVAAPIRYRPEIARQRKASNSVLLSRSSDGGHTWVRLPPLTGYRDATPIVHQEKLYLLIPDYDSNQVLVMRSDDQGNSWTSPSIVIQRPLWNCQTGMALRDGKLYWSMTTYPKGNTLAALCADLSRDLLNPHSWRVSSSCELPSIPAALRPPPTTAREQKMRRPWNPDTWLEPNVVNVNGRLRAILRVVTGNFSTTSLGATCEIVDDGSHFRIDFAQFHPLPGGQCKFFVLKDEVSRLYWMLSNVPTDSQDLFDNALDWSDHGFVAGPGNERRILVLHYSLDALNWFPSGIVAMWNSPLQSFMYPSATIDGTDLVLISRTSRNAPNQHDADLVTFHRIREFRSLAVDLSPRIIQASPDVDSN